MANENHEILNGSEQRAPVIKFRVAFKHKTIPNFKVNKFQFIKGILRIEHESEEAFNNDVRDFMRAYDGLHGSDRASIVRLKEVQNEERLDIGGPKSIRGAVATSQVADTQAAAVATQVPTRSFFSQPPRQ